jgi:hypothetical protein
VSWSSDNQKRFFEGEGRLVESNDRGCRMSEMRVGMVVVEALAELKQECVSFV